jgi:glyoxylase-like metal-dependent hydrolase (beta-lactamase superfamily II)
LLLLALVAATAGCGLAMSESAVVEAPGLRIVRATVASANVYVVEQNGKRLMIDAGNPGDEAEYERILRQHGIEPGSIDYLLLTHGHGDHAGTAAWFQKTHGATVIGGRGDQELIDRGGRSSELCPTSLLARAIRWSRSGVVYPRFVLDRPLDGPLDLAELGMAGLVLPWPGHTPGSLIAVFGSHVFVGDLIRGGLLAPERPATHFFMCDLDENRERIRSLLERRELLHWHPGHFGPLEAEAVRAYLRDGG